VTDARTVLVPPGRVVRWCENFESRHGGASYAVVDGALRLVGADGATAELRPPFDREYAGAPSPAMLVAATEPPASWGVLLVRKGGFAVARLSGQGLVEHKIGQRHVQGRTKAGGQSQQRFARRRDNQARAAYEAAADHAARILGGSLVALVTGGDRSAVDTVLEDVRLRQAGRVRTSLWLPVPDPRRAVLDQAIDDARSVVATLP
jgi:Actinobacteria/chloroflexi VLRF1 release factor